LAQPDATLKPLSSTIEDSTSQAFFEAKYKVDVDPWRFQESEYELQRYDAIVDCLKGKLFKRAFEPGCSIGVLTEGLARFCERVEAMDISSIAASRATLRCQGFRNVAITQGTFPHDIPPGNYDLIVFSEIGYYFDRKALFVAVDDLLQRLERNGTFLAAHWLGSSSDHLLSGDEVHDVLGTLRKLEIAESRRYEGFRIDRWRRV
jgi:SAM-dependent methyltransferase